MTSDCAGKLTNSVTRFGKGDANLSPPQVACPQAEQAGHASTSGQEDEPELYKADDFRMYCMKVRAPYGHPSRHPCVCCGVHGLALSQSICLKGLF